MRASRRILSTAAAVATAAALVGCGGGTGGQASDRRSDPSSAPAATGSAPVAAGQAVTVDIKDFSFQPTPLTVSRGTKITFTNRDSSVHTATAADKAFDSGDLAQNASFTYTAERSGTVKYLCSIHNYMTAEIVVR